MYYPVRFDEPSYVCTLFMHLLTTSLCLAGQQAGPILDSDGKARFCINTAD